MNKKKPLLSYSPEVHPPHTLRASTSTFSTTCFFFGAIENEKRKKGKKGREKKKLMALRQ
jgi:hypothetical protein